MQRFIEKKLQYSQLCLSWVQWDRGFFFTDVVSKTIENKDKGAGIGLQFRRLFNFICEFNLGRVFSKQRI